MFKLFLDPIRDPIGCFDLMNAILWFDPMIQSNDPIRDLTILVNGYVEAFLFP